MLAVGGSGVTRTVEIARPFQLSFNFFYQGLSHSLHLATTCCLVDGHDDNPPDTENDIDTVTSSHISLAPRFLFHIFEYLLARAKYSYHVARLSLSIVRHSFPTIFSLPSYYSLPLPLSLLLLPLLLSYQRLRIPNLSFLPRLPITGVRTTSRRSAIHPYMTDAAVISRPPFLLLSFCLSLERYHIFTTHQT
jgi:hypothetical protein